VGVVTVTTGGRSTRTRARKAALTGPFPRTRAAGKRGCLIALLSRVFDACQRRAALWRRRRRLSPLALPRIPARRVWHGSWGRIMDLA
jgi:hypothetical protein